MRNKKIWLWIIGWLCFFPIPLTILIIRGSGIKASVKLGIIITAWVVYLGLAASGLSRDKQKNSGDTNGTDSQSESVQSRGIEEKRDDIRLILADSKDITIRVGEKTKTEKVKIERKKGASISVDGLQVISDNPDVASVSFRKDEKGLYIYYEIEALSQGETFVYASSEDGSVISERKKVVVPPPIEVESITISVQETLSMGENVSAKAEIVPENADNQAIEWKSSDEEVLVIDKDGNIKAIGGGKATIIATTSNGTSQSVEITVDASQRVMNLRASHYREDDNNIGSEWSYIMLVNDHTAGGTYTVHVGEKLQFYAKFTEADNVPDVGEAWKSYVVTESDLINGFTVSMSLDVIENGGRNKGKRAHFIVSFAFKPTE